MLRLFFACLVAACAGPAFAADPPKWSTPEPDFPADDLRAPGPDDKKYPLPQDEDKSKKHREERTKFFTDHFMAAFEKTSGADAKGAKEAKAALEACAAALAHHTYSERGQKLNDARKKALQAAITAGSKDPLVNAFYMIYVKPPEIALEMAEGLNDSITELKDKKAPLAVIEILAHERAVALMRAADSNPAQRNVAKKQLEDCIKLLGEMCKDKRPVAEDFTLRSAQILLNVYHVGGWGREKGFTLLRESVDSAGASKYMMTTLEGLENLNLAWEARGTSAPVRVDSDRLDEFKKLLKKTETSLTEAWKVDPDRTIAPTAMINVCMGMAYKRKQMEEWFARAMTADPDNYRACEAKLRFLDPKWGGNVADCLSFGRQCVRTKNYFAGLPFILIVAHQHIALVSMPEHVRSNETIWADFREVYEQHLQIDPKDKYALTEYARVCAWGLQWKAAQQHIKTLNGDYDSRVFRTKKDWDAFVKQVNEQAKK